MRPSLEKRVERSKQLDREREANKKSAKRMLIAAGIGGAAGLAFGVDVVNDLYDYTTTFSEFVSYTSVPLATMVGGGVIGLSIGMLYDK